MCESALGGGGGGGGPPSGKQEIGNHHLCKEKNVMNSFSLWPLGL